MADSNTNIMLIKLNRFLFFTHGFSSSSRPPWPSPSPSPIPSPGHLNLLLHTILARLREWTYTLRRPDLFFSLLHTPTLGASKAGTIATLILVGALFLLSLIFFPGPTLIFLKWLAVSLFYLSVGIFILLWLTCRGLFIALTATCRCILSLSDECLLFTPRASASRSGDADYAPLFQEQVRVTTRHPSFLRENHFQQGVGVTAQQENRSKRGDHPPGNRCSCGKHGKSTPNYSDSINTDRQKMKETTEYRRAMEAEWAARQQELKRQAEEARRQRNKKKAENKRPKASETIQNKQRPHHQHPQTSNRRKEEESLNHQKDKIREDIRKKLRKLDECGDMASLLRSLGICVSSNPSRNQVRAAYREACKKFHPDRLARADLRHQIEAEEKFKLISNMKHKF